ncbi:MAG: hypothetical protein ACOYXU_03310 [Nitrospirota bacterium]
MRLRPQGRDLRLDALQITPGDIVLEGSLQPGHLASQGIRSLTFGRLVDLADGIEIRDDTVGGGKQKQEQRDRDPERWLHRTPFVSLI